MYGPGEVMFGECKYCDNCETYTRQAGLGYKEPEKCECGHLRIFHKHLGCFSLVFHPFEGAPQNMGTTDIPDPKSFYKANT